MTETRLSDEDVAAYADWSKAETYAEIVPSADVELLAREVQQARARRCDACRDSVMEQRYPPIDTTLHLVCDRHSRSTAFTVEPDWFCADFAPKGTP